MHITHLIAQGHTLTEYGVPHNLKMLFNSYILTRHGQGFTWFSNIGPIPIITIKKKISIEKLQKRFLKSNFSNLSAVNLKIDLNSKSDVIFNFIKVQIINLRTIFARIWHLQDFFSRKFLRIFPCKVMIRIGLIIT